MVTNFFWKIISNFYLSKAPFPRQVKSFTHSKYPFLLELRACPSTTLLINHIFSRKSKLKDTLFSFKMQNLH